MNLAFSMTVQDDDDMLRQMRTLYIRSNKLLRTFYHCSIDVKLELFRSFCTSFYCCYLWTAYKKSTFNKLRVAFNNAYRRVLVCHGDLVPAQCMLTLVFRILKQSLESLLLDLHNVWPKALIFLLWLLKVYGLFVLIYRTSGKRHSTLLQQHELFLYFFN